MKLQIIALKDRAADVFGNPFYVRTNAEAIRSLGDEVNNKESTIAGHPEDYDLYLVGTFDQDTGEIRAPEEGVSLIIRAQDLVK